MSSDYYDCADLYCGCSKCTNLCPPVSCSPKPQCDCPEPTCPKNCIGATGAAGATGPTGATGPQGETGPTGPAGVITGSVESVENLPNPGNPGDMYLVDGVLYVWNEETGSWDSMGDLRGPTGPAGVITGSVESVENLPNPGNPGDMYLVDGVLYVWNEETGSWDSMGDLKGPTGPTGLIGPTGPTGAAGASILDSYLTLADLIAAHPTGTVGDAYLAGGVLYVWGGDPASWQNMGSLIGPTGPTGAAGASILDSYPTLADLIAAHPTGTVGDAYLAGGVLYVWGGDPASWQNMGSLIGPTGPQGETGAVGTILGSYDTLEELEREHTSGNQGDAYLVDGILYVWDVENNAWTAVGNLRPYAESSTIIPFASQQAPLVHTNNAGLPADVALLGFGYIANADIGVDIETNDRHFDLTVTDNRQVAFSVPFDMTLNSLYITVGNWNEFLLPPIGTLVYPFVQIYAAPAGSNTFFPIEGAVAKPEQGIDPATAAVATMRAASVDGLSINLSAGTRIAICGMMEITGDTAAREYYLYFTGGIGLSRRVE